MKSLLSLLGLCLPVAQSLLTLGRPTFSMLPGSGAEWKFMRAVNPLEEGLLSVVYLMQDYGDDRSRESIIVKLNALGNTTVLTSQQGVSMWQPVGGQPQRIFTDSFMTMISSVGDYFVLLVPGSESDMVPACLNAIKDLITSTQGQDPDVASAGLKDLSKEGSSCHGISSMYSIVEDIPGNQVSTILLQDIIWIQEHTDYEDDAILKKIMSK